MKICNLFFAMAVLALLSFANGPLATAISWKSTDLTLGEVPQNKPVKILYEFTNTGDSPLLITNVQAGCGCTSVDFAKTPVMPGTSSQITAVFNAAAKGAFKKTVTVTSNAEESSKVLTFSGTVVEALASETGEKKM